MENRTGLRWFLLGMSLVLLCAGCAGKSKGAKMAVDLLRGSPFEPLSRSIQFTDFNTVGASATAEGTVTTGFRFERRQGKWVLKEVRLGDREWESVQELQEALDTVRRRRSERDLQSIVASLENYRSRQGAYPAVSDFVSLVDKLHPNYLTRVVDRDGWGREYRIQGSQGKWTIISSGPDGKEGTPDDLRLPFSQ